MIGFCGYLRKYPYELAQLCRRFGGQRGALVVGDMLGLA